MVALLDKRYAKRHGCDGEIIWAYFNKKDYSKARALNFSRELTGGKQGHFGIGVKYHLN